MDGHAHTRTSEKQRIDEPKTSKGYDEFKDDEEDKLSRAFEAALYEYSIA